MECKCNGIKSSIVIVVTGTVAPGSNVDFLSINGVEERLEQYKSALEKLITCVDGCKIVFCENSNFGTGEFDNIKNLALNQGNEFEVLSFAGNSEAVDEYGKGYGEGEILEYVLNNSSLVKGSTYLIKITGRLIVDNIADIVKRICLNKVYFNIPNIHRRDMYDTRLYGMPVNVFNDYFRKTYTQVDDKNGRFLEYVYTDVIRDGGIKVRNFPKYPRIVGNSGSSGIRYEYTEWKAKIRDIVSLFNLYGRIRN